MNFCNNEPRSPLPAGGGEASSSLGVRAYRQLNQLVVFAAGIPPDQVGVHLAGDLVAGGVLLGTPGAVQQHLADVAEFVQLLVVQSGSSGAI